MKTKIRFVHIVSFSYVVLLFTFILGTIVIGGDALSGKKENNRYYVWDSINKFNNDGETLYIEVSKSVYMYNLINEYILLVITPLMLFLIIRYNWIIKKHKKNIG